MNNEQNDGYNIPPTLKIIENIGKQEARKGTYTYDGYDIPPTLSFVTNNGCWTPLKTN